MFSTSLQKLPDSIKLSVIQDLEFWITAKAIITLHCKLLRWPKYRLQGPNGAMRYRYYTAAPPPHRVEHNALVAIVLSVRLSVPCLT